MSHALLITRPIPAAQIFAGQARVRLGGRAAIVVSPLMRIEPCDALPALDGVAGLIFTSQSGVMAYAGLTARRDIPCYAVGDATASAAVQAGMTAVSASGNAGDLTGLIQHAAPKGHLLHLHGEHVSVPIAAPLQVAGLQASSAVIYRQSAQPLTREAQMLLARPAPVIVPLFSPRTARLFFGAMPFVAPILAVPISANAATAIPHGAVQACHTATRPDAEAVLDGIQALHAAADRLEGGTSAQ